MMKLESAEGLAEINQAVAEAESRTSAEIVPVVARCSGRYDRAEDVVGLWFAALLLALAYLAFPPPALAEAGDWGAPSALAHLALLLACLPVGFVAGAALASWAPGARRLFTPRRQMREEVEAKARAVFFDQRIHHTAAGSGVLLYVSLHERIAAIVADQRVLGALGQIKLDALCYEFTDRLRESGPRVALRQTIAALGEELATVLPRTTDDRNELPDALVLMD